MAAVMVGGEEVLDMLSGQPIQVYDQTPPVILGTTNILPRKWIQVCSKLHSIVIIHTRFSNKNLLCEEKPKNVGLAPATQRRVGV